MVDNRHRLPLDRHLAELRNTVFCLSELEQDAGRKEGQSGAVQCCGLFPRDMTLLL